MALLSQPLQGSLPSISSRHSQWNLRSFASFHTVSRTHNSVSLKYWLSLRAHPVLLSKRRPFKVFFFKGNSHSDGADGRDRSSRYAKTPVHLPHMQGERKEITTESPHAEKYVSYTSQDNEDSDGGSIVIKKLFRKWLFMLHTQRSNHHVDEDLGERTTQSELLDRRKETLRSEAMKFLKAGFKHFLKLDASISLPLAIFIPWFLIIKVVYGAEVTKELAPLWIFGPLFFALYIKIIKGLCSLYAFCFIQTVKLVKNLPAYFLLANSYILEGKLISSLWVLLIKPFVDIKNMDKIEVLRRKIKQLEGWAVDKYLDFIESVWPYYCRTIRFLKKANLI
ncbi:hypothetical protein AXF42_Ash003800 [Apostasia shenzhenica]|uniref:Uncharacterized protein n=1 Tax=Apostasia shenzhenica TaxID=1088818 RepID=A0A2I0AHY0_9ASPA|nr:hypothetical protein AXF42_Ash003800 [Apostasia shenzhenica]